jgi:hypothetical protein
MPNLEDGVFNSQTTDVRNPYVRTAPPSLGSLSMWDTLSHAWDPAFQAPALPLGPTHTNYHAFREFTLSVGAAAVMLYVILLPAARRSRPLWVVMAATAACYYGGWWLPGPLLGLSAPNRVATVIHLAATVTSLAGVALAWRHYRGGRTTDAG